VALGWIAPGEQDPAIAAAVAAAKSADVAVVVVGEVSSEGSDRTSLALPGTQDALVDAVVALYRESHPGVPLATRHAADLPLLEVDPDHMKRAVLNLVDNAVQAVGTTGEVVVETVHVPEIGHARIIVSDTGPGISPEDKERLFLPYFSTKAAGMGLGLPIVHEIVTEHGGTIRVEDNAPRGSRFILEVPVSRTAAPVEA